jgi:hypothetical protein
MRSALDLAIEKFGKRRPGWKSGLTRMATLGGGAPPRSEASNLDAVAHADGACPFRSYLSRGLRGINRMPDVRRPRKLDMTNILGLAESARRQAAQTKGEAIMAG